MIFNIAATFLVLSGIASLTYQVTWVRLLGLSMGSTSASISTVLAAFFLGLALGSYLAERITRNRINSLRVYLYLEIIIGTAGLVLLPVLLNLDAVVASFPALGSTLGMKFSVAMVLLTLPTICMGATFPVMAAILVRRRNEVGLRVSQLYSLNTAGAVIGAALAGFVFIPQWGLDGAVYIAFTINAFIVVSGFYFNRKINLPPLETEPVSSGELSQQNVAIAEEAPLRGRALMVLFGTGFVSIATEVGWTKYLSIFTGTTIYGFAAILTVFLIGIASGSWAIKSYLERMRRLEYWMALGLIVLGLSLLLTRAGLSLIPPVYEAINHLPAPSAVRHGVKYTFVFLLLFPPTFIFGVLFPINLKLYCGNLQGVRARIGKAYAVNTIASIFGSIAAGFWLIPRFGTDVLLTVMALLILVLPFMFVPVLHALRLRVAIAALTIVVVLGNWTLPHISYQDLISSVQYKFDKDAQAGKEPKFLFLKEGKAGVISMVTYNDKYVKLQNNGLNESFIDLENEDNVLLVETLLGLVPYFLHDNPKSAFVVGFGGGITTRALTLTKLQSIKVVELEPAVVEAGRAIYKGKIPALADPRVTLEYNDARNTLLIENQHYDIIAAQPSHPWLARASNVFTKEFFEIVKSRLNEGGIYSQWVNLFNMDATTLRSIFKAFFDVFPNGMTFANLETGDLIMFGADHKLVFDYQQIAKRMAEPRIKKTLKWHGIYQPRDLLWYFALSRQEAIDVAGDIPANSDTNILSEVRLSALDGDGKGMENPYKFMRKNFSLDVTSYLDKDVPQRLYSLADYFFEWNEPKLAVKAAKQLEKLDPVLARGIEYEKLWRELKYETAFELFAKYDQWPDRTYQQQALALAQLKRYQEAGYAAQKVRDQDLKRSILAQLLYAREDWQHLAAIKPQGDEERKWQLTGLAQTNIATAGKAMVSLLDHVTMEIPQLRVLVRYYSYRNDKGALEIYTRKLLKMIDEKVAKLSDFAYGAVDEKNIVRAQRLLAQIEGLSPSWARLDDLRGKVGALQQSQTKKS